MKRSFQYVVGLVVLGLVLAPGCNWEDGSPIRSVEERRQQEIVGGSVESGFPSVGAFETVDGQGDSSVCTGTMVGENWVLTSANCAARGAPADTMFYLGADISSPDNSLSVVQTFPGPNFDPGEGTDDVALVYVHELDGPTPSAYNCSDISSSAISTSVEHVGYGAVEATALSGIGVKRSGSMEVYTVDAFYLYYASDGVTACTGDEGAPGFADLGSGSEIIGVVSGFSETCEEGQSYDVRVDTSCSWLEGTMQNEVPTSCDVLGGDCGDDACVPVADGVAYCVPSDGVAVNSPCDATDNDWSDGLACGDGLACVSVDETSSLCRPACESATDCADEEVCKTPLFGVDSVGACVACTDADEDGYCEADDCDDGDASINPGAAEICDDDIDNDCDGDIDDADSDCQTNDDVGTDAGADAGTDAGPVDDAGSDADVDTGTSTGGGDDSGCSCTTKSSVPPPGVLLVFLFAVLGRKYVFARRA